MLNKLTFHAAAIKVYRYLLIICFFVYGCSSSNSTDPGSFDVRIVPVNREIGFAGVMWDVKTGIRGPGCRNVNNVEICNRWSDSGESIWVDGQGRLHLKIRKEGDIWYSAEVSTQEASDYGEHRFLIEGDIDLLDRNVVLGLFIYVDDDNEVDIEYSQFGKNNESRRGHYSVQPYFKDGNQEKHTINLTNRLSTHYFNWQADSINFASLEGHHESDPSIPSYIDNWVYKGDDIPDKKKQLTTKINFWLFRAEQPADTTNLEIIIKDVSQPIANNKNR